MYTDAEAGQYGQNDPYNAFSSKETRHGLWDSIGSIDNNVWLCLEETKKWTARNPWLFWVAFVVMFVTLIMLSCCENIRRTTPHNYVALMVFTFAESFLVGIISSMYKGNVVLMAVLITAVICFALTLFAFQTKIDFTMYNGLLFVLVIVLMLFGFVAMFWRAPLVQLIYASLGALLFSAYLVVDTQMMIGGNHKFQMSEEEYVFAALTLYLDIINIFLYILQILQSVSSD
ncbi:hypothetical protein RDWZM_003935 [Blomia tropicalis]|uniref:Uncharacterized protein n=1 Tax=Blomia tropicalis TaxID=40697 RepID=A0A9Q0MG62_BLOTA|nr:hypothetical protein RDWZM_003935 [Blomia tropicalis]